MMVAQPLVTADQLSSWPGAPFTPSLFTSACEAVRNEAGWHIAPLVTETVTVDSDGASSLHLPTMRLVDVTEVRDMTHDTPQVLDGWRKSTKGMLFRSVGWPSGYEALELDIQHGYSSCPEELYQVIVDVYNVLRFDKTVSRESAGPFSVARAALRDVTSVEPGSGALNKYKLNPRP